MTTEDNIETDDLLRQGLAAMNEMQARSSSHQGFDISHQPPRERASTPPATLRQQPRQRQPRQRQRQRNVYSPSPSPEPRPNRRPAQQPRQTRQAATDNRQRNQRHYWPELANDPQAWYFMTADGYDKLSDSQKRRYTHVGCLLFSELGVPAAKACARCSNAGVECIVYSEGARSTSKKMPGKCAYCTPKSSSCNAVGVEDDDGGDDDCGGCAVLRQRLAAAEQQIRDLKREVVHRR